MSFSRSENELTQILKQSLSLNWNIWFCSSRSNQKGTWYNVVNPSINHIQLCFSIIVLISSLLSDEIYMCLLKPVFWVDIDANSWELSIFDIVSWSFCVKSVNSRGILAPKVLLEDLWPMITNPIHPIPSDLYVALNELNRPKIDLSPPSMT